MSFLAEILTSAEQMEIEQIKNKLKDINDQIDYCQKDHKEFMENVYIKFLKKPEHNAKLSRKTTEILEEIGNMKKSVEQLSRNDLVNASEDLEKYSSKLMDVNNKTAVMVDLCKVHETFIEITEYFHNGQYVDCIKQFKVIRQLLKDLGNDNNSQPVIKALIINVVTEKTILSGKMLDISNENLILHKTDDSNCFVIKIKDHNKEMEQVLLAFYNDKSVVPPLDNLTKFLKDYIITFIVTRNVNWEITEEDHLHVLKMSIQENQTDYYKEIYKSLKTVFTFLSTHLNYYVDDDISALNYIGKNLRDNLSMVLIEHCLENTIPTDEKDLQHYDVVIKDTEDLKDFLKEIGIFDDDNISFYEYATNVDLNFINKMCQNYVVTARDLMKRDLHDMTEVPPDNKFPKCCVSKNVLELMDLIDKILLKTTSSTEVCAGRLICTCRNIVLLYITFVPEYHSKLLETIPQQMALFYNNCHYISNRLTTFNELYSQKVPSIVTLSSLVFNDEYHQLEVMANDSFTATVKKQINEIVNILKNSGLGNQPILAKLDPKTEKFIRQCIRQQEILKTVWMNVLPHDVYNKSLGLILNSLCEYLTDTVVKSKDIHLDCSEQLGDIINMIMTRGKKIFVDPNEVELYVKQWGRLKELAFVLNGHLLDIDGRWADGKGPLALHFKVEELKQLIKALFQDTPQRASLLAKIRN